MSAKYPHYTLKCLGCGKEYAETGHGGFLLTCPENHPPALLRTQYAQTSFEPHPELPGLFRFADWLPARRILKNAPAAVAYHSTGLAHRLGLEHLWIVFSGYWPEKGAFMESGSFKALEAPPVCARIPDAEDGILVVSSAGNTARAFLQVCSEHEIPLVVVVPEVGLSTLRLTTRERHSCVHIIGLQGDADYLDAISLGGRLAECPGFFPEGGVKNVARRDGLGTVLLTAVEAMGRIPQHYFQAVGSGTGGIAVWEASRRLRLDRRFEAQEMRLHLSQNAPFTPIVDAWAAGSRHLFPADEQAQKTAIHAIRAYVLANRQPPYSLIGGVYDALTETRGAMYAVTNHEALSAGEIFLREEGCDLDPAAETAVASLFQALDRGWVGKKESIALNVTGGGYKLLERDKALYRLQPDLLLNREELEDPQLMERLQERFVMRRH